MLRATLRTALAATIVLAACGEDTEDEPGRSLFAGTMTGVYAAPVAGKAVFGVTLDDAANGSGFSLVLGEGGAARIALFAYATPTLRSGTYEIVAPAFDAGSDTVFTGFLTYNAGASLDSFEIRGGSITLTRTNHNRTSGLFELRAERTSPADGAQLTINGTFDAGQIPQVFPLPE